MTSKPPQVTYKGRSLGIVVLVAAQLLIGVVHVASGLWLLGAELSVGVAANVAYDVYTLVFGVLVFLFAVWIWQGKKLGWAGTVAVSFFVIAADGLTLLDLPSIPGIPKPPAFAEIAYSVVLVGYLLTPWVREKFLGS